MPGDHDGASRPDAAPPTLGVVLAGGLARRMGGGDKPLRLVDGRSMLERVIASLDAQCAGLVLNANGDPARFAALGLPVAPDTVAGFAGPLAGILAGLDWCAANRPDLAWVASAAADTPFLPADFVARLHAARQVAGVPLACAASAGQAHPANALWPVSLREPLRASLEGGERKVARWAASFGVAQASWDTADGDPFFNVNAPDDLALAEAVAARLGR